MHRFFLTEGTVGEQRMVLRGNQAHQMRRVLRLRLGERVVLLDNAGWAYEAVLMGYGAEDARFDVVARWAATGEPRTHLTMFMAVLKGERFEWALQKGTEIGVSRFVPMVCERNVVDDLGAIEQKRGRWERIIQEAAEQSGRALLAELAPAQLFGQAVQQGSVTDPRGAENPVRVIPWEAEKAVSFAQVLRQCNLSGPSSIQVYIGPEGGFTDAEVDLAIRYRIEPVSLGQRILRAETAALVAATLVLYEAGDMELPPGA